MYQEKEVDLCRVTYSIRSWYGIKRWHKKSQSPLCKVPKLHSLGVLQTITLVMHVCIYVCESEQGFSHKCQCLTVVWVSRVLTPSIPGEHMDAITQSERVREWESERGKEGNYKKRKEIVGKRENERRAIHWRLACVFGRQKISLIPCSSFPLWICQWRVLVKSSWWFPHPLLLRRRGMIAVTLIPLFGHSQ